MYKYILAAVVAGTAYFLFFSEPYPNSFEFRGITFGSKENENNSEDKGVDIYRYSDKSGDYVFMFAILNDTSATANGVSNQYLNVFKQQGYKFKREGNRYIGSKANDLIYMTQAKKFEGLVVLAKTKESSDLGRPSDADDIFADLEKFSIEK